MKSQFACQPGRLVASVVAVVLATFCAAAERLPNVILIVADDLGYADVGVREPGGVKE